MNPTSHAIVIGGSIAGLLAAQAVADYFERVTIIERDRLPDGPLPRKGVPQASHIHILLARGLQAIESLLPGISDQLAHDGATPMQWGRDEHTYGFACWLPPFDGGPHGLLCSRDFLEFHVRQRVLARANVSTLQAADVTHLEADADGWVRAVAAHHRDTGNDDAGSAGATGTASAHRGDEVRCDFVIDASGRTSRLPEWLEALGYDIPRQTVINSFLGYASRLYRPDDGYAPPWKVLLVRDRDAAHAWGVGIYHIEGGLWQVNLGANGKCYPPIDDSGFAAFIRALPVPDATEALSHAQPVSAINGYRRTENRWQHYEKLARMPHNIVALGDSTCAFNPVYGQGMSVAALGALGLKRLLGDGPVGSGFGLSFQKRLAKTIATPWLMATSEDFRTRVTEGGKPSVLTKLTHRYFDRVMDASVHKPELHRRFQEVFQLLQPPSTLFAPSVMLSALAPQPRAASTVRTSGSSPAPVLARHAKPPETGVAGQ